MENINEQSLSRVWKHFNDPNTTVVIFTSFRDETTRKQGVETNKQFAAELKRNNFGYFFVDGFFPENEGTENEVSVKEDSIFAIADKNQSQNLIKLAHKLANSANQDSIIVKDADLNKTYFLTKSGEKEFLKGGIKPGALGKFYTKLRNKKDTFVFESELLGKGGIQTFREYVKSKK